MMVISFKNLAKLIDEHQNDGVELGDSNCDLNPTPKRIAETEDALGCKLPPSYLWFVKNYGGGEIYGEEICSIYPVFSEQSIGDIAYQTRWAQDKGFVSDTAIVICRNDFGEIFFMDSALLSEGGEYPVFVQAGAVSKVYAENFADFLLKRISNPED